MGLFKVLLLISSSSSLFAICSAAASCEEAATSQIMLELLKQSIISAKNLYPKCSDTNNAKNCSAKHKSLAHLNVALDLITAVKVSCRPCPEPKVVEPKGMAEPKVVAEPEVNPHDGPIDCSDVLAMGFNSSGVYQIWPKGRGIKPGESIDVYCDMNTDKGGWTVIQRRGLFPTVVDFFQNWDAYKKGFGDLKEEFWLGNENIFTLTNQGVYAARFDLVNRKKDFRYAEYGSFRIGNELCGYILRIRRFTGNATDDMQYSNGMMFSTHDRQNDQQPVNDSCVQAYGGAFWHPVGCAYANLNGVHRPELSNNGKCVWWYNWTHYHCLHSVEVKIRRKFT